VSQSNAYRAAMKLETQLLYREKSYVALTMLAAVGFLALVSLFGLTASDAPMALVVHDRGAYCRPFVEALVKVPHAFRLTRMSSEDAEERMKTGHLLGAIEIPSGFSAQIAEGGTVAVDVHVDNVNVDIVTDLQRALPAAIVQFGQDVGLPGLRVRIDERDVWPRDTRFMEYITVSGLALAAFVIAAVLGALVVARELEGRTSRVWLLAPARVSAVLAGKLTIAAMVAAVAMGLATVVVLVGYGFVPQHPVAFAFGLAAALAAFTCIGASIGALVRRTLVVVPLVFGLAMPLYIDSGALEPTRFDGETVWVLSHLTPLYYVVGWLEWAFFGLVITPEPQWLNLSVTLTLGIAFFALARWRVARA
jgi:hypothetical protein